MQEIDKLLKQGEERRREILEGVEKRRTLKEILKGEGERFNLQTTAICVLVVLVLTAVVFGLVSMKFDFKGATESASEKAVPLEAGQ